jgi:hypothetical protein
MVRLETKKAVDVIDGFVKLREPDLNRRPRGYETDPKYRKNPEFP